MKLYLSAIAITIMLLFSGCASILSKSEYQVTINSSLPGTTVTVRNTANGMIVGNGVVPMVVNLPAGNGFFTGAIYSLEATTANGKKHTFFTPVKIDPAFWANLFLGGILGMVIDASTGAMYKIDSTIFLNIVDNQAMPQPAVSNR